MYWDFFCPREAMKKLPDTEVAVDRKSFKTPAKMLWNSRYKLYIIIVSWPFHKIERNTIHKTVFGYYKKYLTSKFKKILNLFAFFMKLNTDSHCIGFYNGKY